MKVQFLLDDLLLFQDGFRKFYDKFLGIYSMTMSQFQIYSPPKKKKFYANLKQKNGLVKRRIVSLCGNSLDSRSICIPLSWYQSVAWTKRGMKHWEGWRCFDLRLGDAGSAENESKKKRGFLMFLNDPSYHWHWWVFLFVYWNIHEHFWRW